MAGTRNSKCKSSEIEKCVESVRRAAIRVNKGKSVGGCI